MSLNSIRRRICHVVMLESVGFGTLLTKYFLENGAQPTPWQIKQRIFDSK